MASSRGNLFQLTTNILLLLLLNAGVETSSWYTLEKNTPNSNHDLRLLDSHRVRRDTLTNDAAAQPTSTINVATANISAPVPILPNPSSTLEPAKQATIPGKTDSLPPQKAETPHDSAAQPPFTSTTLKPQIPNVGFNGSGIHKDTFNPPKVSDPITSDDDNDTESDIAVFKETPEMIKAEHHLSNLTYVNHTFYNSTFVGNPEFFKQHWLDISKLKYEDHPILSSSHRRATAVTLSFDFPFYGQPLRNITVATGGFIYTGDHVHNWLAATQYIAPLMANFDTRPTKESVVKIGDDGNKFTVIWENVTLQEDVNQTFTFAVTLHKNGDIVFAYKDIPIPIQDIKDQLHPVKVGISDAYLQDRVIFYIRRKTIYEYHRVNLKDHSITSGTVLTLHALPTCLLYTSCEACIIHSASFNCSWCSTAEKCSSAIDRKKQDLPPIICEHNLITTLSECSALSGNATKTDTGESTSYVIGNKNNPYHDVIIRHDYPSPTQVKPVAAEAGGKSASISAPAAPTHSSIGGVLVAFVMVVFVAFVAAWIVYAYKNPHTRSGQCLIKYRPSTWSWKRGEARYTAATIHM